MSSECGGHYWRYFELKDESIKTPGFPFNSPARVYSMVIIIHSLLNFENRQSILGYCKLKLMSKKYEL